MMNLSLNSTSKDMNAREEHVQDLLTLSLTFSFSMALLLLYVILAVGYHGCKTKTILGRRASDLNRVQKSASVVNSLILFDAIFTLGFISTGIPHAATSFDPQFCPIQEICQILFYAVAIVSIYIALWYRVYEVLYTNPVLKKDIPTLLRVVNISCVVFLFLCVFVLLGFFFAGNRNILTPYGCQEGSNPNGGLRYLLLVASMVGFQTSLLISFVYPLYMHKNRMLNRGHDSSFIMSIVKRSAVIVGVCVPSDIMAACVSLLYKDPLRYAVHVAYGMNLIINLFGGILSSANWREKLFPFGYKNQRKDQLNSSSGRTEGSGIEASSS